MQGDGCGFTYDMPGNRMGMAFGYDPAGHCLEQDEHTTGNQTSGRDTMPGATGRKPLMGRGLRFGYDLPTYDEPGNRGGWHPVFRRQPANLT